MSEQTEPTTPQELIRTTAQPVLIPQPNGQGALLSGGKPGNKGGLGSALGWFKNWCADQLMDPRTQFAFLAAIHNKKNPSVVIQGWRALAERAFGAPEQTTHGTQQIEIVVRLAKE